MSRVSYKLQLLVKTHFNFSKLQASSTHQIYLPYSHIVVEHFLEFLYTDELRAIENEDIENVCNLLILADEYFAERLKQICEYTLCTQMTLKNVPQLFAFSKTYNAKQLAECCMEFFCLNLSATFESRLLDEIDEVLLRDLTQFYWKWNPILQNREITPYSTAPDDEMIFEVALKHPFTPIDEVKPPKNVAKKKNRNHKSNKLTTNINDSDKENVAKEENLSTVSNFNEEINEQTLKVSSSTPSRLVAINSAMKQIETEPVFTYFTTLPAIDLQSFPELGTSPTSAVYSKSPKSNEKVESKTKIVKLSQKQRKRLSSENNGNSPAVQPEIPGIVDALLLCFCKLIVFKQLQKIRGNCTKKYPMKNYQQKRPRLVR